MALLLAALAETPCCGPRISATEDKRQREGTGPLCRDLEANVHWTVTPKFRQDVKGILLICLSKYGDYI